MESFKRIVSQIAIVFGVLVLGFFLGFPIAAGIGGYLPDHHLVKKSKSYEQPIEMIWKVLSDVENFPLWKPGVRAVETLGKSDDGLPMWREYYTGNRPSVVYEIMDWDKQELLSIKVTNEKTSFFSNWTFKLDEHQGKGIVHIQQDTTIKKPFQRFTEKFVHGQFVALDATMFALGKRLLQYEEELEDE